MTLAEVFTREAAPAPDLRATIRARMIALHGSEEGAQAALARRMAPRWGCSTDSAVKRLQRFRNGKDGKGDMAGDALAEIFAELGLVVTVAP